MIEPVPGCPTRTEVDPLDAERFPSPGSPGPTSRPGLFRQIRALRDALIGLVRAHVELARAEISEIAGEVARAAALVGAAIALLILVSLLVPIGLALFLGEWWFGSMGWGILHATELLVALAVLAVLAAVRVSPSGLAVDLGVAALVGLVVAVVFGAELSNRLWSWVGEATNLAVDPGSRPLVVGVLAGAILGAILVGAAAARAGSVGAAATGAVGGALAGAALGAFSAITFGWRVGSAIGVAVGLLAWPILMGFRARTIDPEALKARFWPQATIEVTKETIEWAKAQTPRGPKS
jgi:hypothetical protein